MSEFQLTEDQQGALKGFTKFLLDPDEQFMIIQGAAGCGKSTLISHLVNSMKAQMKMYALLLKKSAREAEFGVQLTATTNKAVAVLSELSGMEARTIHSLLGLSVHNDFSDGSVYLKKKKDWQLIFNQLIIIDESSMINDQLFELLDETIVNCKVVLIGDEYQLAPVKQKNSIMSDLDCPKVTMNKVMRHSGPILHAGAQFRQTVIDDIFKNIPSALALQHVDGPTFKGLIDAAFTDKRYTTDSAKVVAWTNKRVHDYNNHIRIVKGLPKEFKAGETVFTNKPILIAGLHWPTDCKVIITEVGEICEEEGIEGRMVTIGKRLKAFLPNNQEQAKWVFKNLAKQAKIDRTLWSKFFSLKEAWLDLRPAYASTVHKAQGSTYQTVFIDLSDIGKCNISSDVARMLYVSISRAAQQVYFYGKLPPKYCEE